jgi:hypothetical protein
MTLLRMLAFAPASPDAQAPTSRNERAAAAPAATRVTAAPVRRHPDRRSRR